MNLKAREVDHIFKKLRMKSRSSKHKLAQFFYEGKLILWTKRSHGKGDIKGNISHKIRQDLRLNEEQFREAAKCQLDRDNYIKILKEQKLISS